MNSKKIFAMFLFFVLTSFSFEAWAGPLVWGPKKYVRDTGKPYVVIDSFAIEKPKGKYWLQISNGEGVQKQGASAGVIEVQNLVSSAVIRLNGVEVVGPNDFNQNVYGFTKDITLEAYNTMEVEVRGKPDSFITIAIRKAALNPTVENEENDLRGINMKKQIVLWWTREDGANEYVIYKAYTKDGPWIEWARVMVSPTGRMNAVDGTSEAEIMDLCYKIEALDSKGKVIRKYEPICIPKWQEESSLPLTSNEAPSDTVITKLFDEIFMLQDNIKDDENSHPPLNPLPSREGTSGFFSPDGRGKR